MQADIQEKALKALQESRDKCKCLHVSMRVGKTKIVIDYLKAKKNSGKVFICYPTNTIFENWKKELIKWNSTGIDITFCNFSSIKNYTDYSFDTIIIDEAQEASPNEIQLLQEIVGNSEEAIVCSGTLSKATKEVLQFSLNMKITFEYLIHLAIKDQIVADYQITIHYVNLDNTIKKKMKNGKLKTEKEQYNAYTYVFEALKKQGRDFKHILLGRNRVSQNSLSKLRYTQSFLSKNKGKRAIVFCGLSTIADLVCKNSYHSKNLKKNNLERFNIHEIDTLSLVNMAKSGVTFADLDMVVLNGFEGNPETLSQIVGRAQMLDYNNKVADIHIICLNEEAEIKKLDKALALLDKSKILTSKK